MKKIVKALGGFLGLIVNTIKTPFRYKLDYLSSILKMQIIQKPLPWMNYAVIDYIKKSAKEGARVFEYGSGQSTLFWLSISAEIVSVEHDKEFYSKLSAQSLGSVNYLLIEPEFKAGGNHDPSSPDLFQSSDFKGYSFEKYVKAIDSFDDEFFDFLVIDGRARPSCIKRCITKIKSGGKLILDNSDRDYYLSKTTKILEGWQKKIFRGTVRGLLHLEQTTVWIKP